MFTDVSSLLFLVVNGLHKSIILAFIVLYGNYFFIYVYIYFIFANWVSDGRVDGSYYAANL